MCLHAQGEESFVFSFVYVCLLLPYFCYILIFVSMQCLEAITEVAAFYKADGQGQVWEEILV